MRDRTEFRRIGKGVYQYKGYVITRIQLWSGGERWRVTKDGQSLSTFPTRRTRAHAADRIDREISEQSTSEPTHPEQTTAATQYESFDDPAVKPEPRDDC